MTITISWQEDGNPPLTFTIPADGLASLEAYRRTLTKLVPSEHGMISVPVWPTVLDMLIGCVSSNIIKPAFNAFPPGPVAEAAAAVDAAKAALAEAQEVALAAALAPTPAE